MTLTNTQSDHGGTVPGSYVELAIKGAWIFTPRVLVDPRGEFLEWYQAGCVRDLLGRDFAVAQANLSRSRHGVIRGVHFKDVPPGQAKYVTCVEGEILDVVVDVRLGSPTFGASVCVPLNATSRQAVLIGAGLGHAFTAVSEWASVAYLCDTAYEPALERSISPLDPALNITWPTDEPTLSDKDAAAPTLHEAVTEGWLPRYDAG